MKFPGFIGPTYQARSLNADCQRTVNLYPEVVESGSGKNQIVLYGTPGLRMVATLPDGPVRGLYSGDGARVFVVSGGTLYELFPDGTYQTLGEVARGTSPAQMFASGTQLFVSSAGLGYVADGVKVRRVHNDAQMAGWLDGYFIVLRANSAKFCISELYDGTRWDELDFGVAEGAPDHAVSMLVDHRELWLFGQQSTEVFWNSGNPDFPFERIPSAFIQQGCSAPWSPARVANGVMWLGGNERGGRIAWRAEGHQPMRASNHAVEAAWSTYATVGDAVGFSYDDGGHSFWVLTFPSADATWVYDAATGLWHERGWWDSVHGRYRRHRAQCHCYAWGKHLVGDHATGQVYEMTHAAHDDAGDPIRALRTTPHSGAEGEWVYYSQLQVDLESGVGLDGGVQGSDPQVMMQFSDDGGRTWSNERWVSAGKIGQYRQRAVWRRLGRSRDRVFRVWITDPVRKALVDAYLYAHA